MATYNILQDNAPYYTIEVLVDGAAYVQTIISEKTGAALTKVLDAYANDYAAALSEVAE